MSGNTFGQLFKVTTFGESHGAAIGVIVDGVSPRVPLSVDDIQQELNRRRPGQSKVTTPRNESDQVEILSGVFQGKTTGTPIALLIRNTDKKSRDYTKLKDLFRPGHADFTYLKKYGIYDWRGSGRASGRETAARVAAGAIAKKILREKKITVTGYTLSIGDIWVETISLNEIEKNPVRSPDKKAAKYMVQAIESAKAEGDSLGGIVEVVIKGCPAGLGEPVFNKLDALLAHALMSIGAVKGVEVGAGFAVTSMRGSETNDVFCLKNGRIRTKTNIAGGILGGISTGENIIVRLAVKPPSSIGKTQNTISKNKKTVKLKVTGRHDPCVCPRIVPVAEAMTAITLVDSLMLQKAIS